MTSKLKRIAAAIIIAAAILIAGGIDAQETEDRQNWQTPTCHEITTPDGMTICR